MDATWMAAGELAAAVRARKVSAVELLEHFRKRVDQHNPKINAVVVFDWERANEQAVAADAAVAKGKATGPLHGVPMTVKECFDVEGLPTTAGAVPLKANAALRHADAVKKLVESVVTFQERSTEIIAEMRKLSTQNSAEIRDAVEQGKKRIARLVADAEQLPVATASPAAPASPAAVP